MTKREPNPLIRFSVALMLIIGLAMLGLNMFGLTQPLRKPGLGVTDKEMLRFVPEEVWSYEKSLLAIDALAAIDSDILLAEQANRIVNQSLIHPKWPEVDPVLYRQLIPPWENIFLWAVGKFSGLPQFERYHYADYQRSIERGIGICGDASIVLSSVLSRYGIQSDIVSFRGHVIVEYVNSEGEKFLLDPDFGVAINHPLEELIADPSLVRPLYLDAGYPGPEVDDLVAIYSKDYSIFDDTYSFMTKRYLFERVTYALKWVLPVLLILPALVLWLRRRQTLRTKR